jgi:hypothetical protein
MRTSLEPYKTDGEQTITRMQRNIAHWAFVGVSLGLQWTLGCAAAPAAAQSPAQEPTASEGETAAERAGSIEHHERTSAHDGELVRVSTNGGAPSRVLPWLSPSHVAAAVRAQEPAFVACQAFSNDTSARSGAITVGWLVDPDGSVAEVTLGRSTFASDLVNECVLSVARQVTFPASASSAQVFWTIRLSGTERGPFATATGHRSRR